MSDQELYQIAQQRVNRRNRRWILWGIDLAILTFTLAALIASGDDPASSASAAAVFMGWSGIFVLHTVILATQQNRDKDIEQEVARLRSAAGLEHAQFEKPKRLELTDDGELKEPDPDEEVEVHPHSSAARG